jgi:alpha-tubulin suppressor-like RCC1 family protein
VVSGPIGVTAIALGESTACAIDGSQGVWCWGFNEFDELGHTGTNAAPAQVSGVSNATMIAISSNAPHVCVGANGDIACWGMNEYADLGHPGGTDGDVSCNGGFVCGPAALALGQTGVTAVSAPQTDSYWIDNGAVFAVGSDANGEIGNGTISISTTATPTAVNGITNAVSLSGGQSSMCVVGSDHSVSCWGTNAYGALGRGNAALALDAGAAGCNQPNASCFTTPAAITSFDATRVSCASATCIAIAADGTVWGWGLNSMGQAGHPPATSGDESCGSPAVACAASPVAVQGL